MTFEYISVLIFQSKCLLFTLLINVWCTPCLYWQKLDYEIYSDTIWYTTPVKFYQFFKDILNSTHIKPKHNWKKLPDFENL